METPDQSLLLLWPDGVPSDGVVQQGPLPTLRAFLPSPERATGAAMIVCPGGGYVVLADHEADPVAQWLASLGITAFVLRYRLHPDVRHPAQLLDAARAVRTIRARAEIMADRSPTDRHAGLFGGWAPCFDAGDTQRCGRSTCC